MQVGEEELRAVTSRGTTAPRVVQSTATPTHTTGRFTPTFLVEALSVDDDVEAGLDWVRRVSLDPFARTQVLSNHLVVTEYACSSQRQTLVRSGDVLVQQPGSRFGWDVYSAPSFRSAYNVRPLELPICDDGEVA